MSQKRISPIRSHKSLTRKPGNKPPRPLVLIVCEGQTEKLYFEALRKELRFSSAEIYQTKHSSPINTVELAEKKCQEPYDHAYCVFDRDNHESFNEARQRIKTLATKKRNPLPLKEAVSIVCFEIWILLHFTKSDKQFASSEEVIKHLEDKGHIANYDKTDPKLFDKTKSKLADAIKNAEWLAARAKQNNCNPYTQVHELVELLYDLSAL